jgi:glycopeptide antibiotics resistance protein
VHNEIPSKSYVRVVTGTTLLSLYALLVLLITMWPTPLDQGYESAVEKVLKVLHRNGVPTWFGYNKLEFFANVLMFIPVGALIALTLTTGTWWLSLIAAPALSIAIELTQASVLTDRFATFSDVLANSTGALIGITTAVILRAMVHARDEKVIARAIWELRPGNP